MSRFEDTAARIFEAAESASDAGSTLSDLAILIAPEGGLSLIADSGWSLASLQMDRGARMAYRVSQRENAIRVEGRSGSRTCLFEATKPGAAARLLLDHPRQYVLSGDAATPVPHPAGTWLTLPAASD